MKTFLPVSAVIFGIVLLILGLSWSSLFPVAQGWTPEKSGRLSELGSEANKLQFEIIKAKKSPSMHSGQNPAELQAEYDKILEEYSVLDAELKSVRGSPASTGNTLKWLGVIIVAGGAVAIFTSRQEA